MQRNSDIRLIYGRGAFVAESIKEFLSTVNFQIDQEKRTQNNTKIKSSNLQKSFIKLYLSNSPQIVTWHIEQKSDEQVQIEVKCDLFTKFRVIYFVCLCLLSTGFTLFFISSTTDKINPLNRFGFLDWFSNMSSNLILAIIFLILALLFYLRSLNNVAYDDFLNRFYKTRIQKNYGSEIILQNELIFPDIWKCFFLFIFFFFITLFFAEINIPNFKYSLQGFFIVGAIITITLLGILLYLMVIHSAMATRIIFALTGFALCVPIIMYSNTPIELSYYRDMNQLFENHYRIKGIENIDSEDSTALGTNKNYFQKFVRRISTFYLGSWLLILLLACVLLFNLLQLPIRIIKDLSKFSSKHSDSNYYQALQPDDMFGIFNFVILLLWVIISIANIFGLYFAISVFEKTIFNSTILFNSELATLFFNNTKAAFIVLLGPNINYSIIPLFHKMVMLIYSIPLISILVLVLKKNITSALAGYLLLKRQSGKHEKIENRLTGTIKQICNFVDIQVPITKVINSQNIYAETKFLGFPMFKNILVISEGAWIELKNNEAELHGLLAHEIWHIKKHTLRRRFLCFLSDYSLFGNGFLAILQNSFEIEKEADDFAIKWLIKKYHDADKAISALKSLLERIEETNWRNTIFQPTNSLNFAMLKNDSYRDELFKEFDDSSKIKKLKINLKLLYQMYFGEEIISYFHPSISQRIAWVEENYGTTKTN